MNPNHHHHHHHHHKKQQPANLKPLRTRFALKFLKSLKKINLQQNKQTLITHQNPINNNNLSNMVAPRVSRVKMAADVSMASAVGPPAGLGPGRPREEGTGRAEAWAGGPGRELRRLVPGGEAMDMQSLLDETAHYIKCLSTQVRVMRCILNYCSNSTAQQVIN